MGWEESSRGFGCPDQRKGGMLRKSDAQTRDRGGGGIPTREASRIVPVANRRGRHTSGSMPGVGANASGRGWGRKRRG